MTKQLLQNWNKLKQRNSPEQFAATQSNGSHFFDCTWSEREKLCQVHGRDIYPHLQPVIELLNSRVLVASSLCGGRKKLGTHISCSKRTIVVGIRSLSDRSFRSVPWSETGFIFVEWVPNENI